MKGDFTRNTFDPKKHYRDVLLQQGRVLVDADFNEQAELTARRDETTTADIVGNCGGPADNAAFRIFTQGNFPQAQLQSGGTPVDTARAQQLPNVPPPPPLPGDFFLTTGHYYVDGIQCENEQVYSNEPCEEKYRRRILTSSWMCPPLTHHKKKYPVKIAGGTAYRPFVSPQCRRCHRHFVARQFHLPFIPIRLSQTRPAGPISSALSVSWDQAVPCRQRTRFSVAKIPLGGGDAPSGQVPC